MRTTLAFSGFRIASRNSVVSRPMISLSGLRINLPATASVGYAPERNFFSCVRISICVMRTSPSRRISPSLYHKTVLKVYAQTMIDKTHPLCYIYVTNGCHTILTVDSIDWYSVSRTWWQSPFRASPLGGVFFVA